MAEARRVGNLDYITVEEAARRLGVDLDTFHRFRRANGVKVYEIMGDPRRWIDDRYLAEIRKPIAVDAPDYANWG